MSENRYGEKREESETGMKLQNCETQESENKVQESTNEQIKDMGQVVLNSNSRKHKVMSLHPPIPKLQNMSMYFQSLPSLRMMKK